MKKQIRRICEIEDIAMKTLQIKQKEKNIKKEQHL